MTCKNIHALTDDSISLEVDIDNTKASRNLTAFSVQLMANVSFGHTQMLNMNFDFNGVVLHKQKF